MDQGAVDVAIAGGGLAGGLTALAIHRAHPHMRLALLEAGETIGGNHRWSWFESDTGDAARALLAEFRKTEWNAGYDVRFPAHSRHLSTPYRSMASADFAALLASALPPGTIRTRTKVARLHAQGVVLDCGAQIPARTVIDCRNFVPTPQLRGGWQVFAGRHLRLAAPHGLTGPLIMDAKVEQFDAYRFVYLLPLTEREIFVEDTYYADSPALDREALDERIETYCAAQGWAGEAVGREAGVLPVIVGGDPAAHRASMSETGVALAGARGLFCHPLSSYTLPIALENARAIARHAALPGPQLAALMDKRARQHWRKTRFYRRLGRMLLDAAEPELRYRVFERFYRLPELLIERFYAARSTQADRMRVLLGKPPVPVGRAMVSLLGKGTPLVQTTDR